MKRLGSFLMLAALLLPNCGLADSPDATVIPIREGHVALEFVGQFNNTPTTSQQFGYLSNIDQLGREGRSFRTTYSGQANAPGLTPSGWFAGYAVGAN